MAFELIAFGETIAQKLRIRLPIRYVFRTENDPECDAYYQPKYSRRGNLQFHVVALHIPNVLDGVELCRSPETLIAHELIHAWQEENNKYKGGIHNKAFIKKARKLAAEYKLQKLYVEGVDTL